MRVLTSLLVLLIASSIVHADEIAAGQKLVEVNCSRCHAIGMTGDSPLAKAPPFREVVTRYPPESLGEALVEGIVTGHNEMPEFVFELYEFCGRPERLTSWTSGGPSQPPWGPSRAEPGLVRVERVKGKRPRGRRLPEGARLREARGDHTARGPNRSIGR